MTSLSFRVPDELHERLRGEAKQQGVTLSDVVLWHLIERQPVTNNAATAAPGGSSVGLRSAPHAAEDSRVKDLMTRARRYSKEAAGFRVKNKALRAHNAELEGLVEEWRAIALENLLALRRLGGSTNG